MSAFFETSASDGIPLLVNLDNLAWVCPDDEKHTELRFCFGIAIGAEWSSSNWIIADEPYRKILRKIRKAATSKEKENIPPTPPIREKDYATEIQPTHACTREGNLTCEGILIPTLEDVKKVAATLGIPDDTAEDFWSTNMATGWTYKGSRITAWHHLLKAWHRAVKRAQAREKAQLAHIDAKMDERAEKRTAHIDAKMDEREAKRERRSGGGRKKADNYIASTPEQVKEFTDGL